MKEPRMHPAWVVGQLQSTHPVRSQPVNTQFSFLCLPASNHQIGFWQQVEQFLVPGLRAPGRPRSLSRPPGRDMATGGSAEGTSPGSACGLKVYNLFSLFVCFF